MNTYCGGGANPITFESKVVPVIGTAMNYDLATNKPRINGVELIGNKTNEELLIDAISNEDLEQILK